jgi:Pentapeptide repeats (8 copies)
MRQPRRWPWILAGLAVLAGVLLAVWKLPPLLYGDVTEASPDARLQAANSFRTALIAGLAGLAALGSLAMAARAYQLTQQTQLTERYTKAIEQLGSEKLDVRLGGIYALERTAVDSERDQPTVAEVLSAFVREHSRPPDDDSDDRPDQRPATDVQAAITVLGRLPERLNTYPRADLRGAYLKGAVLHDAHLEAASFIGTNLEATNFIAAHLEYAVLVDAHLEGAALINAHLKGAILDRAYLKGALLDGARLEGADLTGALGLTQEQLLGATLDRETQLPALPAGPGFLDVRRQAARPRPGRRADG